MRTSIKCPRTAADISIDIQADRATVLNGWNNSIAVECPHCGTVHDARYADLYMEGVMSDVSDRVLAIAKLI